LARLSAGKLTNFSRTASKSEGAVGEGVTREDEGLDRNKKNAEKAGRQ